MESNVASAKSSFAAVPTRTEEVAKMILDADFKVHTALGPGLLESVYETCLVYELKSIGFNGRKLCHC